jgi:site-specific recombinase XerD
MVDALFARFEGAYSKNTIRAYRADFSAYAQWCHAEGLTPVPASGQQLADYVDSMAGLKSVATIQRRVASLGSLFRLMEQPDATKGTDCLLAVKRARRKFGRPQRQATPLTHEVLLALQATCDSTLTGQRDRLMLQLGYETLRRRSELVKFRFRDVARTPAGTYRIRLFRSKTDQFGQGLQLPVSPPLVTLIHQWQELVGSHTEFILPAINAHGLIMNEPLADAQVNKILRARQQEAGLDLELPLSGHSFRVGGALDLLKRGVPMEKIMLRGGWKSESTALRYLREWVGDDMLVWEDT